LGHPGRLLDFENSIPGGYQINKILKKSITSCRLLIIRLITGYFVKSHPALVPTALVLKNRQFLFVNYSRIKEPPVPDTSKPLKEPVVFVEERTVL
jgi:hypothetical protein